MPNIKHILVIRLSAMGDVAMTVPILRILTQTYPELQVSVLTKPFFKPLFDDIKNVKVIEADVYGEHKGFGLIKLANHCKSLGIDAVADLHNVIRSKIITKTLSVKGLSTAIIDKGRSEKKALVKQKIFKQLKTTHERYAEVFAQLNLPIDLKNHHVPKPKKLTPQLNELIGVEPKKLIGIAPFAAYNSKMYPLELQKEVIKMLDQKNRYKILLFGGGKKEVEVLKQLDSQFENVTSVAGKLSFKDELVLISNLDVMLAMDSGNGHLSAMYGIPTITLWGVTHPFAGFVPFNQKETNQLTADNIKYPLIPTSIYGNKFPEGYENAMETISPIQVVDTLLSNL
jgi:ADP-heptose:LPS heptosyltransferase